MSNSDGSRTPAEEIDLCAELFTFENTVEGRAQPATARNNLVNEMLSSYSSPEEEYYKTLVYEYRVRVTDFGLDVFGLASLRFQGVDPLTTAQRCAAVVARSETGLRQQRILQHYVELLPAIGPEIPNAIYKEGEKAAEKFSDLFDAAKSRGDQATPKDSPVEIMFSALSELLNEQVASEQADIERYRRRT